MEYIGTALTTALAAYGLLAALFLISENSGRNRRWRGCSRSCSRQALAYSCMSYSAETARRSVGEASCYCTICGRRQFRCYRRS